MLFSSTLFLFSFLPIVLAGQFVLPNWLRNAWLLLASLVFYAWGEPFVVAVMLASVAANWVLGLWVERDRKGLLPLLATLGFNLGMLVVFKYADWLIAAASDMLQAVGLISAQLPRLGELWPKDQGLYGALFSSDGSVRLPIGISFFTFQAMSYVIDVRRGEVPAQRNPLDIALYIALFPQLIAGPIVRYVDIAKELVERRITSAGFAYGIRRFVIGLGKKMLIANTAAQVADKVFGLSLDVLPPPVAWLGIVCYTIQIYFDFSGYSDMAIGLGHMLGFRFLENFNYPYIARSITEFWRRWHISLSTWFRDYLYIPLGGNRGGAARTYFNLVLVFALCGLWHGASFSFLAWGLFHGGFLVLERVGLQRALERCPAPVRHAYVLLVVMVGWVFFRAETLPHALGYLERMAFLEPGRPELHHLALYLETPLRLALVAALIGATPFVPWLAAKVESAHARGARSVAAAAEFGGVLALSVVFVVACMLMAAGTYNPFIYFRF